MIIGQAFLHIIVKCIIVFIGLYESNHQDIFFQELADKLKALRLLAPSRASPKVLSELTPPTTNDMRSKETFDKDSDKNFPCITTSEKINWIVYFIIKIIKKTCSLIF